MFGGTPKQKYRQNSSWGGKEGLGIAIFKLKIKINWFFFVKTRHYWLPKRMTVYLCCSIYF